MPEIPKRKQMMEKRIGSGRRRKEEEEDGGLRWCFFFFSSSSSSYEERLKEGRRLGLGGISVIVGGSFLKLCLDQTQLSRAE